MESLSSQVALSVSCWSSSVPVHSVCSVCGNHGDCQSIVDNRCGEAPYQVTVTVVYEHVLVTYFNSGSLLSAWAICNIVSLPVHQMMCQE